MGQKRKHRTHVRQDKNGEPGVPRSFVVKHGHVGGPLTQLVRDIRQVMEPNTATRLKERARNKLKDYIMMAPALRVTHLLVFTLTDMAPCLRILRLPVGPSLTFRIERYSLSKDILKTSKRVRSLGLEYLSPPLLVCASFPPPGPGTPPQLTLLVKAFQSLFPALSPNTLSLSSARRVVLLSYDPGSETVSFRHYLITIKPYGVSKRIRKVVDGITKTGTANVLDLGKETDIADYFLRQRDNTGLDDEGYESATSATSSIAGDDPDTAVDLPDDYFGRNNRKGQRRAVKLDEIGPRMEFTLLKMTEGLPGKEGSVIYHKFMKKTKKELAKQKAEYAVKVKLKKQRREEQERNVAIKRKSDAPADENSGVDDEDEWDDEADMSEVSDSGEENEIAVKPWPRATKKRKLRT